MKDDLIFYVGIINKGSSDAWYINQPMGKNTLFMTNEPGIQGRKTNHCARKTDITAFIHAGVEDTLVQSHSGHTSLSSFNVFNDNSCASLII